VLELVRDGALDALSIGFQPVDGGDKWDRQRSAVERVAVRLNEISIVTRPAYADALISGVRGNFPVHLSRDAALRRLSLLERLQT